ncbi:hypothetical protein lerEdw1_015578 [Lerista edwardsae]|nr:hypothetical protein lerEdw1_015578 [Lerista edwardsae]
MGVKQQGKKKARTRKRKQLKKLRHVPEMTLQKHLQTLKEERNNILSAKSDGEKPSLELLNETQAKRQEIIYGFQQHLQFLKEQEELQLATLEDLEGEIEETRDNFANTLEDEIACITGLISEIEEKCNQPADEFLENIGSILERCETQRETFWFPAIALFVSSDTKERLKKFSEESTAVQRALAKCREIISKPNWIKDHPALEAPAKVNITGLDSSSLHEEHTSASLQITPASKLRSLPSGAADVWKCRFFLKPWATVLVKRRRGIFSCDIPEAFR